MYVWNGTRDRALLPRGDLAVFRREARSRPVRAALPERATACAFFSIIMIIIIIIDIIIIIVIIIIVIIIFLFLYAFSFPRTSARQSKWVATDETASSSQRHEFGHI